MEEHPRSLLPAALEELLHLGEEALALRAALAVALRLPPRTPPAARAGGASGSAASRPRPGCTCRRAPCCAARRSPCRAGGTGRRSACRAGSSPSPCVPSIAGTSTSPPSAAWRHAQRHAHEDVGAVALEDRVRPDGDMHIEIAGRRALPARLALAGEPDARAVLDARPGSPPAGCARAAPCRRRGRPCTGCG